LNAQYIPSDEDFDLEQIMIIVSTTGNCSSAIDTMIIDFTPFVIPNVFSPYPASPGFNDYFVIDNLNMTVELKVWDRWGSLVYLSEQYQNDWDGHGLIAGVYFYQVKSSTKEYKGWVQLMR
jgi:gliding motility-associated-like protein